MKIKTIYVDMDGVLADYHKAVRQQPTGSKFRELVFDQKIFETLDILPGAERLISLLEEYKVNLPGIRVHILSSCGMYDPAVYNEVSRQKDQWLMKQDILGSWVSHYTHCGEAKAKFANSETLLIDDMFNNIHNFTWNGGNGVLWHHRDIDNCLDELNKMVAK